MPVLMYHHFIQDGPVEADTVVSAARFEEQMRALQEGSYTAITVQQLSCFVRGEGSLPEKPILITMDDGYTSNLEIAAPILERYGMTATVFVIGINVGQTHAPHTGQPMDLPRFGWEQARVWVEKGVIEIQSHTYDMHQHEGSGPSGRDGVLPMPGENSTDYCAALQADFAMARDGLWQGLGVEMDSVSFPYGLYSPQAVQELERLGVVVTFTTQYGCSRVVPGKMGGGQCLKRWGVDESVTGEQLLSALQGLEIRAKADVF